MCSPGKQLPISTLGCESSGLGAVAGRAKRRPGSPPVLKFSSTSGDAAARAVIARAALAFVVVC